MNVAKLTLSSLSMPLDSMIVNSRKIIDITGAKKLLPGYRNQKLDMNPKNKDVTKILRKRLSINL